MIKKVFSPAQGKTPGVLVSVWKWVEPGYFIPHWTRDGFAWLQIYQFPSRAERLYDQKEKQEALEIIQLAEAKLQVLKTEFHGAVRNALNVLKDNF